MKSKAIVYDWDGVISDNLDDHFKATCAVFEQAGVPHPERDEFYASLSLPFVENYKRFGVALSDYEIWRTYNFRIRHLRTGRPVRVFPGAREVVIRLNQKGFKSAVVSGSDPGLLMTECERSSMASFFEAVIGGAERKAEALRKILKNLDCSEDSFFVSDFAPDMAAGREAGLIPIGITTGISSADRLTREGARHCVNNLQEFERLVSIGK